MSRARNLALIFGSATPGAVTVTAANNTSIAAASFSISGGPTLSTSNSGSLALGSGTISAGSANATAIGYNAYTSGANATAIGINTSANGYNSTTIGNQARANGAGAVAIAGGLANGTQTLAVGLSTANGNFSMSIAPAYATGIGYINASNNGSISIGSFALSTNGSVSFGTNTYSSGNGVAIGMRANTNPNYYNNIAIGPSAYVNYTYGGIAIGYAAGAAGAQVVIGSNAYGTGQSGTAIGPGAQVPGNYGVSVGSSASAANNGVAVGTSAAAGNNAVGLGYNAQAFGANGIAIGAGVQTFNSNEAIIGSSSHTVVIPGTLSSNKMQANGSVGLSGYVLTSGGSGSNAYWSSAAGGFSNGSNISVASLEITAALTANGGTGTAGQVLTSSGTGVYWSTVSSSSGGGGGTSEAAYTDAVNGYIQQGYNPNYGSAYQYTVYTSGSGSAIATAINNALTWNGNNLYNNGGSPFQGLTNINWNDGANYNWFVDNIYEAVNNNGNVDGWAGYGQTDSWSQVSQYYVPNAVRLTLGVQANYGDTGSYFQYDGSLCTWYHNNTYTNFGQIFADAYTEFITYANLDTAYFMIAAFNATIQSAERATFYGVSNIQVVSSTTIVFSYTSYSSVAPWQTYFGTASALGLFNTASSP